MNYYVYVILNPLKPSKIELDNICLLYEPFYIGKGKGQRIKAHLYPNSLKLRSRKNNTIKSIKNKGLDPIFIKLSENLSESNSLQLEKYLVTKIGRLDLKTGPLTNLTDGGDGASNLILEKTRKIVYQFDLNGFFIKKYKSITEAANLNNLKTSCISSCCLGKARTHGGFYWSFKMENNFIENKKSNKVIQFDLKGNKLNTFINSKTTSESLNIDRNKINNCCSGNLYKVDKFYFRYENNIFPYQEKVLYTRKIIQILNGKEIIFDSVNNACKSINISLTRLIERCKYDKLYDNLEVYYLDEYLDGFRKNKMVKGNGERKIYKIQKNTIIDTFDSITDLCKIHKMSRSHIYKFINKKEKNGYLYVDHYYLLKNNLTS